MQENSFGEGADWLEYYKMVLESAKSLPWAKCKNKTLILVGTHGTEVLGGKNLNN